MADVYVDVTRFEGELSEGGAVEAQRASCGRKTTFPPREPDNPASEREGGGGDFCGVNLGGVVG